MITITNDNNNHLHLYNTCYILFLTYLGDIMKYLILIMICVMCKSLYADFKLFDSIGYRYYHDLDNEREGSKFRTYASKKVFKNDKLKMAYERKRTGRGFEAGTFFVDYEFKF